MQYIAFIFARGGSKGLPGKNIRPLSGKPLIGWAIEHARAVRRIGRVIVSTDSEEIAAVAREHGAEVPFLRPPELARDDSPEWFAWRHALQYMMDSEGALPEAMVSIPTTAPLRISEDIERCLEEYEKGGVDAVITVTDAHRSPYFNMVALDSSRYAALAIPQEKSYTRRQDAPKVFDMATVAYVVKSAFVMDQDALFNGRVRAVHVPKERALDIDTLLDFQIAECLMQIKA